MTQIARLPRQFQPMNCVDLVRLGKPNDGGYIVSARSIAKAEAFLSGGILDDWSFEQAATGDRPLVAFDPTIGFEGYFRRFITNKPSPKRIQRYLVGFVGAKLFFRANRKLVFQALGPTIGGIHLTDAIHEHLGDWARNIFLKLDIEGAEYGLLDEILRLADRLTGLVIEFHDVQSNINRIESFIDQFPHGLVHVHCNNYSSLGPQKIPGVVELSFSRYFDAGRSERGYPTELDQPNNPLNQDFKLSFNGSYGSDCR